MKRKMIYVAVSCQNGIIYKLGQSVNLNEATEIMHNDFRETLREEYYTDKEIDEMFTGKSKQSYGVNSTECWFESSGSDLSLYWKILNV